MALVGNKFGPRIDIQSPVRAQQDKPTSQNRTGSSGSWEIPADSVQTSFSAPGLIIPKTVQSGGRPMGVASKFSGNASAGIERFEQAEADKHKPKKRWLRTAAKVGTGAALAGISLIGAAGSASAQVAPAATQQTVTNQQAARDTRAVLVSSPEQAVEQFSSENQLYVVGEPTLNGEPVNLESFESALKEHPNVYVVINGNHVDNLEETEADVGRGIGNHQEFMDVRDSRTGERSGVFFYINLNVNNNDSPTGRATLMRSEGLADQLGVGDGRGGDGFDAWFPDGEPGKLGQIFVNSITQEGKDLGESMLDVFSEINGTIDAHANKVLSDAQADADVALSLLNGVGPTIESFQEAHGTSGELGSPNLEAWKTMGREISEALETRDFDTLDSLSTELTGEIRAYEESASGYLQAAQGREPLQESLSDLKVRLQGVPDNGEADTARADVARAQEAIEKYEASLDAKSLDVSHNFRNARLLTRKADKAIQSSHDAATRARNWKIGTAAVVTVGLAGLAFVSNRKAGKAEEVAKEELVEAKKVIAEKSKALLELLDEADFDTLSGFKGETKFLADEIMDSVLTGLTLVGGFEKFIAESSSLIEGNVFLKKVENFFSTKNFDKATDLLKRDEDGAKLSFGTDDSSRAVFEEDSSAATWREEILQTGETRQFEASLREVLSKMDSNYKASESGNSELRTKVAGVNDHVESLSGLRERAERLQGDSKEDGLFSGSAITGRLLPQITPKMKDGVVSDPVKAHKKHVLPAERTFENANGIMELAEAGRNQLVPVIEKAELTLSPHGVNSAWATSEMNKISERLESITSLASQRDLSRDLKSLQSRSDELQAKVETVLEQDADRRIAFPKEVDAITKQIEKARSELFTNLQKAGAFRDGSAEKVLDEIGTNPSEMLTNAQSTLDKMKSKLSSGDVKAAGEILGEARGGLSAAKTVIKKSRSAFDTYAPELAGRQTAQKKLTSRLESSRNVLKAIKAEYQPKVVKQLAEDMGIGKSLVSALDNVAASLGKSEEQSTKAVVSFDRAKLLESGNYLRAAAKTQESVHTALKAVEGAEKVLRDKQNVAVKKHRKLETRLKFAEEASKKPYVRERTLKFLSDAEKKLKAAGKIVNGERKSPYDAQKALSVAENMIGQAQKSQEKDKSTYDKAESGIKEAKLMLKSVKDEMFKASDWDNSQKVTGAGTITVTKPDVSVLEKPLSDLESDLAKAENAWKAADYEEVIRKISSFKSKSDSLSKSVKDMIALAKSELSKKVRAAKASQRRKSKPSNTYRSSRTSSSRRSSTSSSPRSSSSSSSQRSSSSSSSSVRPSGRRRSNSSSSSSTVRPSGRRRSSGGSSSSSSRPSSRRSGGSRSSGSSRPSGRRRSGGSSGGFSSGRKSGGSSGSW